MEKVFLEECIDKNMSLSDIGKIVDKKPSTINYWLNKFNLKTNNLSFKQGGVIDYCGEKHCPKCKKTKSTDDFYKRRGKDGGSVYCKICTNNQTLERQRKLKEEAIEYKGGCCQECGYDKYNGALEFHHLDPSKKDFTIGKVKSYSFNDVFKKELDKCILVCSNCHREIHGGVVKIK
jgi:hypothetical protein